MTVEAIFAATVQLLSDEGAAKLTTTRVAGRAGMSVGTMYQYFPNKQALLYALLERHLAATSTAMDRAAGDLKGQPLAVIADGLAGAWLTAKTGDVVVSRAIYAVALDFDIADLIDANARRVQDAVVGVLTSVPDAAFDDPSDIALMLVLIMGGAVRAALGHRATPQALTILRRELPRVCRSYLFACAENAKRSKGD